VIVPGQQTPIVIATRPVDFRRGHAALAATVQNELGLDPHSGLTVVFRSKRMDRVKILVWDGTGLVLLYKRLDAGAFVPPRACCARFLSESDRSSPDDRWPQVKDGVMRLTRAQFEVLFEGLDWRRLTPRRVRAPAAAD